MGCAVLPGLPAAGLQTCRIPACRCPHRTCLRSDCAAHCYIVSLSAQATAWLLTRQVTKRYIHVDLQELVGPDNLEEVVAAARDAGRPIGVHLYLFRHYDDDWGWHYEDSRELQVRWRLGL